MCGIAGFCGFQSDYTEKQGFWNQILVDMRESIKRRGSDNTGEYLKENVGLSHTRLAIRDLAHGSQPIIKNIHGREYAIVYNGEIYNADEIKGELQRAGYVFKTTTDTEVILFAYIHYGIDSVKQLNGIFAYAIWDQYQKRLVLCRDRVGIKPLFYTVKENTLVFGSEPKALFCHPFITPQVDINSFREIFGIGPARTPGNGVFKDISEIKPGHYAVFSKGGLFDTTYWELKSKEHTDSEIETVEKVGFLVRDAIVRQMVSDVPVCSFLSGGVDSSIVTAIASQFLQSKGAKLNTFSFDFNENDIYFASSKFQPERDKPFIEKMLSMYDVNHTYLQCDEADLARLLFSAVDAKDAPGMTDIDASLLYFCSVVKAHNKVALTGECADEIFGGYPWFFEENPLSTDRFPWSSDLSARTLLLSDDFAHALKLDDYVEQAYRESVEAVPLLEGESAADSMHRKITGLNIQWFMQTLLDRMDRASMYSGLEARVPFADHRVIEYIWNVPWKMKYKKGVAKYLLREAFKDLLPEALLYRKKSPYPKTYHPNYTNLVSQMLLEIVNNPNAPVQPLIHKKKVITFLKTPADVTRPWFGQLMAAPQLIAYIVQVNYWLEKYM